MADLSFINSMLAEIAEANDGTNHGSEYLLDALPPADSLAHALDEYFSAMSTSNTPAQPAERWNIRTTQLIDPNSQLRLAAKRWFYELEFSPTVDVAIAEQTLNEFMNHLNSLVDTSNVFEVNVDPPMWYECVWQDFAFDGDSGLWILHFGFTD